jgi:hypothetical protein
LSREQSELFVWFVFTLKSFQASYSSFSYRPLWKASCSMDSYMTDCGHWGWNQEYLEFLMSKTVDHYVFSHIWYSWFILREEIHQ